MDIGKKWYKDSKLGMFIHWGVYSVYGHGEWARSYEKISTDEYQVNVDNFNPKNFNPKEWAKLAKSAGMKYAVFTTKHHDGFCLFDSKYTDYKSTNTKFGRDAVAEFLEAFRAEGIKVGLYYSLIDWHHEDYPTYGDTYAPMRDNEAYKDKEINFDRYLDYMHNQIEELCANYGKLDLFWFDYAYDNLRGEAWRATKLVNMIRSYHPDIIMNNRLEVSGNGLGSLVTENPNVYSGDFVTPEQLIPNDGIRDIKGKPVMWEACITTNNHWGYHKEDSSFKSGKMLVRKLVECVSKGGNLIINIGPDADGVIPEGSVKALSEMAEWMSQNGESIYGCGVSDITKPDYGRITRCDNVYYYHVMDSIIGPIALVGVPKDKIKRITLLNSGKELPVIDSWIVGSFPDTAFVTLGEDPTFTYELPDKIDTVIKVEL